MLHRAREPEVLAGALGQQAHPTRPPWTRNGGWGQGSLKVMKEPSLGSRPGWGASVTTSER